jgi:hypothetical protein
MSKRNIFNIFLAVLLVFAVVSIASAKDEGKAASAGAGSNPQVKSTPANSKESQQKGAASEASKPVMQQKGSATEAPKSTIKQKQEPAAAEAPKEKELTRTEMLADLKSNLAEASDELLNSLPGIKVEKGVDGKLMYTFKGVVLDKLSTEELTSLFIKVRQTNTRLRIERIQRQLETVRRTQERTTVVPVPPAVPQTPRVPTTTRPPAPPAAPPSTRR